MLLSEAFELYRSDVIVFGNYSPKTEERCLTTCRNIIAFLGDIEIESLTMKHLRDWKIELDKTRGQGTVRQYILMLRVVLKLLKSRGYDVLDPDSFPIPKRSDTVPAFISPEEVSELIKACDSKKGIKLNKLRNKAIISLLYASGLRVSELCGLDRQQLKDSSFTVVGKGGKARLCFIDQRTKELISDYLCSREDNHPALFINNQTFERMTPGTVQHIFKVVRKRAGFTTPIHPHTLRHSFATNLLRNNTNLRYVQAFMGHASLQTTQMYTHVVDADLQAVYNKFHSIT